MNKRQKVKLQLEVSVRLENLHQDKGISELIKRFPKYLKSNIYIHEKSLMKL